MSAPFERSRLRMGKLVVDVVTFDQAIDVVEEMWAAGEGGSVFTPNVDHTILVADDERFRRAYDRVGLSVADGMPIVWASHLLGHPLPERVAGSDLVLPLIARAEAGGRRVYLLGGGDGVAERTAKILCERFPKLIICGFDSPRINMNDPPEKRVEILARVKAAKPDLVFVALGAPKQELWIDEVLDTLRPAVLVGVGAGLDFVAGTLHRAPQWMSKNGLEWLYRLGQEPRRLWRRYLVRGPRFIGVVRSSLRLPRSERLVRTDGPSSMR